MQGLYRQHPASDAGTRAPAQTPIASWSNVNPTRTTLIEPTSESLVEAFTSRSVSIARGAGRSPGDSAYVGEGRTLSARKLDQILALSTAEGTVKVQAGVPIGALQTWLARMGYHVPVYGGTQWATVGGGIAADIHGKGDPHDGSFGNQVASLELLLADGSTRHCSPQTNPELFAATIGGVGLTGFIRSATLRIQPIPAPSMRVSTRLTPSLDECIERLRSGSEQDLHYCSWVNLAAPHPRGISCVARYTNEPSQPSREASFIPLPRVQIINRASLTVLDRSLDWLIPREARVQSLHDFNYSGTHERLFHWNRLFGKRGVIAHHFAASAEVFPALLRSLIRSARHHEQVLAMAVMKRFGSMKRAGLLSFPLEGYTLNFQVPDSPDARAMLRRFSSEVIEAGGRFYLVKDALLHPEQAARMLPKLDTWREVVAGVDPEGRIRSDLCTRLQLKPWAPLSPKLAS